MALSDRKFAAQVRQPLAKGQIPKVYKFDDIGCAVTWLEDRPWKEDKATEIWVVDHHTGGWIDARKASYVTGLVSPMGYGLGAQAGAAGQGLDFAAARDQILGLDHRQHMHHGDHR